MSPIRRLRLLGHQASVINRYLHGDALIAGHVKINGGGIAISGRGGLVIDGSVTILDGGLEIHGTHDGLPIGGGAA